MPLGSLSCLWGDRVEGHPQELSKSSRATSWSLGNQPGLNRLLEVFWDSLRVPSYLLRRGRTPPKTIPKHLLRRCFNHFGPLGIISPSQKEQTELGPLLGISGSLCLFCFLVGVFFLYSTGFAFWVGWLFILALF